MKIQLGIQVKRMKDLINIACEKTGKSVTDTGHGMEDK